MNILHRLSLLRKIKAFRMEAGELVNDYQKEFEKNRRHGAGFLGFLVILFCLSDGFNYFSSFDVVYTESYTVLIVLSATLAIILNYSNTVIVKFLTSDEEVQKGKKIVLWIGTFLMLMVIASILIMLYLLRFSIIDVLFGDDVTLPAAQAMTLIWASIAVGTTVASFGFSCINNLIIIPFNEKLMKKSYHRLATYLLQKKEAVKDELTQKLQLYDEEHDALMRTHEHNLSLIKSEGELLYQLYLADSYANLPTPKDKPEDEDFYPMAT